MTSISPTHYHVRIEPDLKQFTFSGHVEILLQFPNPVREVTLNMLEIAVWGCELITDEGTEPLGYRVDPGQQELSIMLPETSQGSARLGIDYTGRINDRMAGFYRSRYTNKEGVEKTIAVTQFQESDARQAFPCLDHPRHKATFDIEMVIDDTLTAVSNGKIVAEQPLENGKKRVKFERTPKMSTYLVFFGVGDFTCLADTIDPRVRAVMLPGFEPHFEFGIEFGRKSLSFSETYYDIPYPMAKLDLIAVPDFAFGAMENWGAITFRENLLLFDPETTSGAGQERICEVIAHEIAHQWFGNLVTPSGWQYIWLNESFATYFGYGVVDHYYPQWQTWDHFLMGATEGAMGRDALCKTMAIEIPGGDNVAINAATVPIIYNKGGSILRQIHRFLGDADFQSGLRQFLKNHAYQCAASHHLWEALEDASSKPVTKIMQAWVEQPGFPLIHAERTENRLVLTQERFTYLPEQNEHLWPIPVSVTWIKPDGDTTSQSFLMEAQTEKIDIPADVAAFKMNSDQAGFYRVHYPATNDLEALGHAVGRQTIDPKDRWGVQNDLYAMVKAGRVALDVYLDFLKLYRDETEFLPLAGIAANLFQLHLTLVPDQSKDVTLLAKAHAEKILTLTGNQPRAGESHPSAALRDLALGHAVLYGSGSAAQFVKTQFRKMLAGETIHADILRGVLLGAARLADGQTFPQLTTRLETTQSEHERMQILAALGSFSDPEIIGEALAYTLDHVPSRNKFIPISAAGVNPRAVPMLWEWYKGHLDRLESFHPLLYERVIEAVVPVAGLADPDNVRGFFRDYLLQKPVFTDVVTMSLEKMEINLRLRRSAESKK
jgi:aminopeptidase N